MRTDEQRRKTRESTRRWRAAYPVLVKQLERAYYLQRREKILERQRQRRIENPEMFRERSKRDYVRRKDAQPSPYHGLSRIEVRTRLTVQNGACAICKTTEARRWHGDHDHKTGAFRGVLCSNCNSGMGLLADDAARCRAAAEYLERHAQLQSLF